MSFRAPKTKRKKKHTKLKRGAHQQQQIRPLGPPKGHVVLRYGPRGGLQRQSKQSGVWYSVDRGRYSGHHVGAAEYDDYGNYGPPVRGSSRKAEHSDADGYPGYTDEAPSRVDYPHTMQTASVDGKQGARDNLVIFPADTPVNFLVGGQPFVELDGEPLKQIIRTLERSGVVVVRASADPPRHTKHQSDTFEITVGQAMLDDGAPAVPTATPAPAMAAGAVGVGPQQRTHVVTGDSGYW